MYNKDKYTHAKPLMKSLNALNIFQINIYQILVLMFKSQHNLSPIVFQNMFEKVNHKYPTKFADKNFVIPRKTLKSSTLSISSRGPIFWNSILTNEIKSVVNLSSFQNKIKQLIFNMNSEMSYF